MTNPVAFLIGAGASFPYGVPMMIGFYNEFRAYIERRHPHCFQLLRTLEENGKHTRPDLETLLTDIHSVLGVEQGLAILGGDRSAVAAQIETARELHGYLDAFIVDRCERFDHEKSARDLQSMLALRQLAPLWVFSTNYDRIIENACEAHGISWCDGFEPNCPRSVANWIGSFDMEVRIVKLHGSANWYQDDPGGALHRLDRGYSLPAHDFRLVRGAQQLRPLMIIPTLEKQALGDPYIGLATRFTDVLKETRVLIVAGNSLRDRHIKAYIKERLPNLYVLLVSPSAGQNRQILDQPERTLALNAGFSEFLTLGGPGLLRLAQAAVKATDDLGVRNGVEQFIAEVSRDVEDEAAILGDPELQRLWTDLQAGKVVTRISAVKALEQHPHPAIVRRLMAVLRVDPNAPVRVAAVDALVRLAGVEATEVLGDALVQDASPDVQMEAALALMHLGLLGSGRACLQRGLERTDIRPVLRTLINDALTRVDADHAKDES